MQHRWILFNMNTTSMFTFGMLQQEETLPEQLKRSFINDIIYHVVIVMMSSTQQQKSLLLCTCDE